MSSPKEIKKKVKESKDDAINLEENSNLNEKVDYYKFFLLYIKMGEKTYYPKTEKKY